MLSKFIKTYISYTRINTGGESEAADCLIIFNLTLIFNAISKFICITFHLINPLSMQNLQQSKSISGDEKSTVFLTVIQCYKITKFP